VFFFFILEFVPLCIIGGLPERTKKKLLFDYHQLPLIYISK